MFFKKPLNFNMAVFLKAAVIMLADVLATGTAYFLGLWFRYDFSFQEMREVHFESFLHAIGPWCLITIAVFLLFRLYSSIWAFVSTSEVFRIIGAYVVLAVMHKGGPGTVDQKLLRLESICVEESIRGHGIGKTMVEEVRALAKAFGCSQVILGVHPENDAAVGFYQKCGFRIRTINMDMKI